MTLSPKQIAELLAQAAELMARAEAPGVSPVERVQLLQAADLILDECERSDLAGRALRQYVSNQKLH